MLLTESEHESPNGDRGSGGALSLLGEPITVVRLQQDGTGVVVGVATADGYEVGATLSADELAAMRMVPLLDASGAEGELAIMLPPVVAAETSTTVALVIDDEATNREYYAAAFGDIGWTVEASPSGAAGIADFAALEPAMVLVDVRLPDTNGYEVCRQLRTLDRRQAYVVLMSADPSMVEPQRAANAGADLALVGPIGMTQLQTIIDRRPPISDRVRSVNRESRASSAVGLQLFGEPHIEVDGRSIPIPVGAATDIISVLAIHHPSVLSTADLGELAWSPPATSASPVHTALSRLRNSLAKRNCPEIVVTSQQGYRLDVRSSAVDTLRFEHDANALSVHGIKDEEYVVQAEQILARIGDTAFGSSVLPVVEAARVRIWEARAVLEERLSVRQILLGNTVEAVAVARQLTARELWRESAWTILIAALYHSGRQREALETYQVARNLLVNSVGVDPSPALRDIETRVLNQDPILQDPEFIRSLAR